MTPPPPLCYIRKTEGREPSERNLITLCRIFGVMRGEGEAESLNFGEIAAIMFPALVAQGPHAYGWMTSNGHEIEWQKQAGRCDTAAAGKNILENVPSGDDVMWMVGHTRWATHGSPLDVRNDHPIPHDNIIGVHNGVLRNHDEILKVTGREDDETMVDSEAIFAAVNKWGHLKGLRKITGDMVAIYGDVRKANLLWIARTHGRFLYLAWTTKGNLIFASERQAIERLEPEIQIRKWSSVSMDRVITLKAGRIVKRQLFVPEPAPKVEDDFLLDDEAIFHGMRNAAKALKRGNLLAVRASQEEQIRNASKKAQKRQQQAAERHKMNERVKTYCLDAQGVMRDSDGNEVDLTDDEREFFAIAPVRVQVQA